MRQGLALRLLEHCFIDFYSKEGDLILDCFAGRGTNLLVGAALGRKVVGYDLTLQNLEKVKSVAMASHRP